jgi:hypothetical protein
MVGSFIRGLRSCRPDPAEKEALGVIAIHVQRV